MPCRQCFACVILRDDDGKRRRRIGMKSMFETHADFSWCKILMIDV